MSELPKLPEQFEPVMFLKSSGILSGQYRKEVTVGDDSLPWHDPIIKAFIESVDFQQITLISTNIGIKKTITKYLK